MNTDLGTDVSTYKLNDEGERDLDPTFAEISGPRVVAEAVARGFETSPGDLVWSPEDGVDIARYLNADLDAADILALSSAMEADARRDERVETVRVVPRFDERAGTLDLSTTGTTGAGPFELVFAAADSAVTKVTP